MMDRHEKWMLRTAEYATETEIVSGAKVACLIVYKNRLISIGYGQYKTDPFHAKFSKHEDKIYIHAETMAIKSALRIMMPEQLANAAMYICRVKLNGKWGLARPCAHGCRQAIAAYNIKKVIYSTGKGEDFIVYDKRETEN